MDRTVCARVYVCVYMCICVWRARLSPPSCHLCLVSPPPPPCLPYQLPFSVDGATPFLSLQKIEVGGTGGSPRGQVAKEGHHSASSGERWGLQTPEEPRLEKSSFV